MDVAVMMLAGIVGIALIVVLRFLQVIRSTHSQNGPYRRRLGSRNSTEKSRILVFLGSGGHTGEMLRLLNAVDFDRYAQRTYLVSSGDSLSLAKVAELEAARNDDANAVRGRTCHNSKDAVLIVIGSSKWSACEIPRARRVHQSFLTAPFTTLQSFAVCFKVVTLPCLLSSRHHPDIILLNGPGSCVPIAIAAFLPRVRTAEIACLQVLTSLTTDSSSTSTPHNSSILRVWLVSSDSA